MDDNVRWLCLIEAIAFTEGEGLLGGGAIGEGFIDFFEGCGGGDTKLAFHNFIISK